MGERARRATRLVNRHRHSADGWHLHVDAMGGAPGTPVSAALGTGYGAVYAPGATPCEKKKKERNARAVVDETVQNKR